MTEREELLDLLMKADNVIREAFIIEMSALAKGCSHDVATEMAAAYLNDHPGYEASAQAIRSCL